MEYGQDISGALRDVLANLNQNDPNAQGAINLIHEYLSQPKVRYEPYTYNAVYWTTGAGNNLAAGAANVPFNVNIQSDADFLIINQTYSCNQLNAARTTAAFPVPNITVLLTDTGTSATMMDQPVPVEHIFGTAQFPYILPQPKLMLAKATLQVLATNFDAAAGYNLRLSFNGVKLYR
jgi:hypothetical protein